MASPEKGLQYQDEWATPDTAGWDSARCVKEIDSLTFHLNLALKREKPNKYFLPIVESLLAEIGQLKQQYDPKDLEYIKFKIAELYPKVGNVLGEL